MSSCKNGNERDKTQKTSIVNPKFGDNPNQGQPMMTIWCMKAEN